MDNQLFVLSSRKKKTSHILHLLLCIPTLGFWLVVWAIIATLNHHHNRRIDSQLDDIVHYKASGLSESETLTKVKADNARASLFWWKVVLGVVVVVLFFIFK